MSGERSRTVKVAVVVGKVTFLQREKRRGKRAAEYVRF